MPLPTDVKDELIPVAAGLADVPLRQVADVVPAWKEGQIVRRNGIYTATVLADVAMARECLENDRPGAGDDERQSGCPTA